MSGAPRGAVVVVGTELLRDGRVDTNGPRLSGALLDEGIDPVLRLTVGDVRDEIAAALRTAAACADVIVVSGGLGPTFDDLTREAASDAFGLPLERRADLETAIRARYESRGLTPPAEAFRMAAILRGAEILPNGVGSAPGQCVAGPPMLALLPGVPPELESMLEASLRPRLRALGGGASPARRVFKIAGMYESQVESRVGSRLEALEGIEATILASPGEITLILRASPGRDDEIEKAAESLRAALGENLYSEIDEGIEARVGAMLVERSLRLATAESCTAGMLGGLITRVPGASRYYVGGFVCYADAAKIDLLGVDPEILRRFGAVSAETAVAMAAGARARTGADVALSVTGIAGPGGATEGKPVGLVHLGLAAPWGETSRRLDLRFTRAITREISCRAALDLLRRRLLASGKEAR